MSVSSGLAHHLAETTADVVEVVASQPSQPAGSTPKRQRVSNVFTEEQAIWLEHSFVKEALTKVPDNQWSRDALAAGRKEKGAERLLKYHTPDSVRQHLRTHLKRKSADYAHQLVAQSQSLAQPMDVDGHSTSTPKNKKQRKEMDRRMSAITSEGVRDLFGGDEGKSFPRKASGISAAELEKMKKEKEKQFENDPRTSSMTSSVLLDLFGTAVAKE